MIDEVKFTKLPNGIAVQTEHIWGGLPPVFGYAPRSPKPPNSTEFAILLSMPCSKAPEIEPLGILLKLTAWGEP